MNSARVWRLGLIWTGISLAAAIGLLLLLIAALDAGYLRGAAVRWVAGHTGREIHVDGALRMHLWSLHPSLIAEQVSIGNPPWTPPGITAKIEKLSLVLAIPGSGDTSRIQRLELEGATLYLSRDSAARANWQQSDPAKGAGHGAPLIRSLLVPDAHVLLEDDLRRLKFDGTVSAQDGDGKPEEPLRIAGAGQLNGRAVSIELIGDPLAAATHDKPYHFTFSEASSGSQLRARGMLLRPFEFSHYDASFEATGADLKDLRYLIGMNFINTARFELSGKLARRGRHSQLSDLMLTFGQSDVHGSASIESSGGRSTIDLNLNSRLVRMADLGLRAAGRQPQEDSAQRLLLPDAVPDFGRWRRYKERVDFHAERFDAGPVPLRGLDARIAMDYGNVAVTSLTANVLGGKLSAHLGIDARTDSPTAELNLDITDAQLGQLPHKGPGEAPMEGPLRVRVSLKGPGKSIHQFAAGADGTLTAMLAHGKVRASLVELAGIDLRGLGLLLAKSKQEDEVRCGVAAFEARDGTLSAQNLVVDTDEVLIGGQGTVNLGAESLDLKLQGQPKGLRFLRLRAPLLVRGTVAHPKIGVDAHESSLVLVDRGRSKDVDCEALLGAPEAPAGRP